MKPPIFLALLALAVPVLAEEKRGDAPDAPPSTPAEQLAQFHVPPGFEVQLVAAEPDIQKPINLNFDAAGHLWATGSELYPWPARTDANGQPIPGFDKTWEEMASAFRVGDKAPEPPPAGRDTVRILSDFAPDGHARKIVTFADNLNIPTGIQPLVAQASSLSPADSATADQFTPLDGKLDALGTRQAGSLRHQSLRHRAKGDCAIVFSIPNIWLAADMDGDGRAETFEPLYEGFGFTDTHGMSSNYLYWIDGWIYGCHGFRNHSEVKDRTGRVTVFDSGNTYRFRPDGSQIEYYTHGQTNPFGLTVDPLGNFFSADSHSKPVMLLIRGGYYAGIGKQHDGLGFAPTITDDDHGSSAIAGIAYYADDKFPEEYRGNLFNGNPVTRRINRDRLEWHGSTTKAIRMPDFLTCDDPWFRPVQVKLGPDGALWIADFYNPIIGHYEVPLTDPRRDHTHGRIWRVVWKGEGAQAEAPGNIRVSRVGEGVPPPRTSESEPQPDTSPIPQVPQKVRDGETPPPTRETRMEPKSASLPDLTQLGAVGLVEKLADPNLIVRTLATNELVGRIGQDAAPLLRTAILPFPDGVNETAAQRACALMALLRLVKMELGTDDYHSFFVTRIEGQEMSRILALKFAAVNHPWSDPDYDAFNHTLTTSFSPMIQRAAWELLSLQKTGLGFDDISPWIDRSIHLEDAFLAYQAKVALREYLQGSLALIGLDQASDSAITIIMEALLAVPTPEAAEFILSQLHRKKLDGANAEEFLQHVVLHLPEEMLGKLSAILNLFEDAPAVQRLNIADRLKRAAGQRGVKLPDDVATWSQQTMLAALTGGDDKLLDRAIAAVRDEPMEAKAEPLRKIASNPRAPGSRRAAALESQMNLSGAEDLLVRSLNDSSNMILRKKAVELLSTKSTTGGARSTGGVACGALLSALPNAPAELAAVIATALVRTDDGCAQLLDFIETGKASATLLRAKPVTFVMGARNRDLQARAAVLTKDLPLEDARLDKVIAERAEAFRKAQPDATHGAQVFQQHCAVCHRFRNAGGNVGPNLDGVAARGIQRLVEDILDPNRNVDPAFHQTVIETNAGQTFVGANPRDDGSAITLTDATGKDATFAKADVKSRVSSKLSLMPPIFETQLAPADLFDLLRYLGEPK